MDVLLMTKQKRFRRPVQILLTVVIGYALLALFVMLVQRKLIYLPAKFSPTEANQLAQQEGFEPWQGKTGEHMGWRLRAKSPAAGAVLIAHGNAGCAAHRGYMARPIHAAADFDVYVLEYPGYGCRAGSPSQRSILAAADEALEALPQGVPIYIVSESLGTGVAAHLAGKYSSRVAGLALFAPYDNLSSVGQSQMPFLPVSLLLWDRFHPAESLRNYRGPIKVVLAEADTIIPSKFGQRLYDGYHGPKSVEVIAGAGHNDIAEQTPNWWKETVAFWEKNSK